jgi:hypothetical protein
MSDEPDASACRLNRRGALSPGLKLSPPRTKKARPTMRQDGLSLLDHIIHLGVIRNNLRGRLPRYSAVLLGALLVARRGSNDRTSRQLS